ncbi:hypothetical protein C1H46_031826 [Malus baccata]|uniref:Pectinesterase n=1 Tax=Malus baccata TaxID=106549 RepID=A0A540L816_MALBA|nr:hypothetical protein C1H46_031826 [Malus baccata]
MAALVLRVAQDGSGDFRTVQEAIDAVPLCNTRRTVIRVARGIYLQPVYVPKTKNLITLAGLAPELTVLTWNNTATKIEHHQASRVIGTGTFGCGSAIVEGEDFIAENITFENSAPEGSGQAVAIRVTADRCAFYNCRFLGWQDTLYLHYGKQYLKDCYVEGSVDFIFGNSTALLEHCHIHCKSAGFITAQSRKSSQETTGYVFLRCVITGNGGTSYTYLGRPWGPFGRVVFAYTFMDGCIKHVGWNNWGPPANLEEKCDIKIKLKRNMVKENGLENLKGKPIRKQERICHAEAVLKSKKTKHREPLTFYFRYTIDEEWRIHMPAMQVLFLSVYLALYVKLRCKSMREDHPPHIDTQSWLQNTFDINLSFIISPLLAWVPDNVMQNITESLVATVMDDVKLDAVLLADYDKFKTEKLNIEV